MKVDFSEEEGCFYFDVEAENLQDAILLARFGINSTKKLQYSEVLASNDKMVACFTVGKRKQSSSSIKHSH